MFGPEWEKLHRQWKLPRLWSLFSDFFSFIVPIFIHACNVKHYVTSHSVADAKAENRKPWLERRQEAVSNLEVSPSIHIPLRNSSPLVCKKRLRHGKTLAGTLEAYKANEANAQLYAKISLFKQVGIRTSSTAANLEALNQWNHSTVTKTLCCFICHPLPHIVKMPFIFYS